MSLFKFRLQSYLKRDIPHQYHDTIYWDIFLCQSFICFHFCGWWEAQTFFYKEKFTGKLAALPCSLQQPLSWNYSSQGSFPAWKAIDRFHAAKQIHRRSTVLIQHVDTWPLLNALIIICKEMSASFFGGLAPTFFCSWNFAMYGIRMSI